MKKSWVSSAFSDDQSTPSSSSNVPPRATRATKKASVTSTSKTNSASSQSSSSSSTTSVAAKLTPMISKLIKTEQQVNNSSKKISSLTKCPLIEKYRPKTRSELAVHKTKIEQLSNLIDQITTNKKNGSILIIEGPPGCGKNATFNVLCNEKSIDVMTRSQPNMTLDKIENNELNNNNNEYIAYESQTKLFDQFLFKSSRYISDQIFNTELRVKKLLFIKDIPYFAYREPAVFQNQMRKFIQYSKYSLVILSTNSPVQSNEMNPAKVLTQELRKELNINEITFNPLAASYMLKTIERIALLEGLNFVNENSINEICETSDGDLRHAINILELAANKSSKSNISTSTAKKRKLNTNKSNNNNKENQEESSSSLIQKKDTNLSIFRGLGKVLHRKNDDTNQLNIDIENKLSSGLKKKKLFRSPLLYSPEDILSKLPISEEITVLYLHQNYLELYGIKSANSIDCETQLESLSKINDNFIASDIMNCKLQLLDQSTSVYNTKHKEMPALLSIRSILFYSYFEKEDEKQKLNSKSLWMPLHKPYNYKCNELKANRKNLTRKCLFRENNTQLASYLIEMQSEFFTTILPFANLKNMYRELASKYTNSKQLFKQPKSILNSNNENDPDYFLEDENSDLYSNNNNNNKPTLNTIETTNNNNGKLYEYDDNVIIQAIYDF